MRSQPFQAYSGLYMQALCLEPPYPGDVPLSPAISGLPLVPLVAPGVLGKTVLWGTGRNLGKSLNKVVSISQASGPGFLRPARASLGKM